MDKRVLVIQSVSDLITNSSSEVFLFETSDSLKDFFKERKFFGGTATTFDTIEDVKKFVTNQYYNSEALELTSAVKWTGCDWECLYSSLKEYKTPDEIFDFFKFKFEDLVGKTIVQIDNNYSDELVTDLRIYERANNTTFHLIDRDSY